MENYTVRLLYELASKYGVFSFNVILCRGIVKTFNKKRTLLLHRIIVSPIKKTVHLASQDGGIAVVATM